MTQLVLKEQLLELNLLVYKHGHICTFWLSFGHMAPPFSIDRLHFLRLQNGGTLEPTFVQIIGKKREEYVTQIIQKIWANIGKENGDICAEPKNTQ